MASKRKINRRHEACDEKGADREVIQEHSCLIKTMGDATHQVVDSAEEEDHEVRGNEDGEDGFVVPHRFDDVGIQMNGACDDNPEGNEMAQDVSGFVVQLKQTQQSLKGRVVYSIACENVRTRILPRRKLICIFQSRIVITTEERGRGGRRSVVIG